MTTFIIRRLLESLVTLLLVSMIIFLAIRLLPGDPIQTVIAQSDLSGMSAEKIAELRHQYGLDKPIYLQYVDWLGGVLHGDLGTSIFTNTPVADEIFRRLPITFTVGIWAILLGTVVGIPLGVISANRRGKKIDHLIVFLTNIGITVPVFWLGLILMLVFGLYLRWVPVMGYTSPFEDLVMHLRQLAMPVICLAIYPMAAAARQTRSSMLEVLHQDYVRTARAKGLKENVVIYKHALKNGLIPVITTIGLSIPVTVGGSTVIETVFNIPGMGRLAVNAVQSQDYAYVQGIILIIALMVLLTNLLVDLAYGWADPRIRYR
ncbi:ABC transporter permease [Paenibacillus thalictri]|uniref:ABC transporter permease n=1 Tax=Paenibacillus thalictri TaxID=2527873 RepID=A0A4V2J3Y3_9BACL|nr:ABC transporter permease [Paenibacillus thalictri]TBL76300.1 ABC transporter permease [Paenibacillus thalictri]